MKMKALDLKLDKIKDEILKLHEMAKDAMSLCLDAMYGDEEKRKEVSEIEKEADVLNTDVDNDCLMAVALYQPVARDLRFVASIMRMSANYERITDLADKIAEFRVKKKIAEEELKLMQKTLLEMFDIVADALEGNTESLREKLVEKDDLLDDLYLEVIQKGKEAMKSQEDINDALIAIFSAKHLERSGDILSKNGARIIFIEEGRRVWIK